MSWLKKNRKDLVPWVKDFKDPQDHIRFSNNVKEMSYNEWFWCHPSSFKLVYYASPIVTLFFCIVGALYGLYIENFYTLGISLVLAIIVGSDLFKKLKNKNITKHTTMYDLHLRDNDET